VALSGPAAMRDRQLYVALFDPLRLVPAPQPRPGTRRLAGGYAYSGDGAFLGGGGLAGGLGGADCGG